MILKIVFSFVLCLSHINPEKKMTEKKMSLQLVNADMRKKLNKRVLVIRTSLIYNRKVVIIKDTTVGKSFKLKEVGLLHNRFFISI